MKRLGIFVFYDREGIVDTYVEYLLSSLTEHLEKLVVVCNGKLSSEGRVQLGQFTDEIYIRENTGYDAMAYKLAMTEYMGWEALERYDEIILLNDTFYGPLYPWSEVFERMDVSPCDFWGLACHREGRDYYTKELDPSYIQSYFMVFRRKMFLDSAFQSYWNAFDSTHWIFSEVANRHEKVFTQVMERAGFSWDVYVHAEEYESDRPEENFIQYHFISYQMIRDHRYPALKKKNFVRKRLVGNPGELGNDTAKSLAYIAEQTEYDTELIWQNLLRLYDMEALRQSLNLSYVISGSPPADRGKEIKATVIVCKRDISTAQQSHYIQRLKEYLEVYEFGEISPIDCRELILFLFSEEEQERAAMLQRYSAIEEQWGNLAGDRAYTENITELFSRYGKLGVLQAPCGIHGADFGQGVKRRLHGCMALWCRREIFQSVQSCLVMPDGAVKLPSAEELRISFMQAAQRLGYYTADGMSAEYASMAYCNMREMLTQVEEHTKGRYPFGDFGGYLEGDMLSFCRGYPEIFVYGAGENGYRAAELIVSGGFPFSGFIISDDQPNMTEKYGFPVFRLSMVGTEHLQAGVVISVANRNAQREMSERLRQRGWEHIYLL